MIIKMDNYYWLDNLSIRIFIKYNKYDLVYNLGDFINKILYVLIIWYGINIFKH